MQQLTLMFFVFFAAGKNKDAEGNQIGRGIGDSDLCSRFSVRFGRGLTVPGDGSTKLADDQFCTVTVTGDTALKVSKTQHLNNSI